MNSRNLAGLELALAGFCVAIFGLTGACGKTTEEDLGQGGGPREESGGSKSGGQGGAHDGGVGVTDGGAGGGSGGIKLGLQLDGEPLLSSFVRLTHSQWQNSVLAIFELPSLPSNVEAFAAEPLAGTFSNNEKALVVGNQAWADHQRSATQVAEWVAGDASLLEKLGGVEDPLEFIRRVGKRAFRRPLTDEEVERFAALWHEGETDTFYLTLGDPAADGARIFLEALLQSPHFLYRIEQSPVGARLSGLELAAKLALLLTDTTPSDALLEAAEAGELDENGGLIAAAEQMLDTGDGSSSLSRFHFELYRLDQYAAIDKDVAKFPAYTKEFNRSVLEADQLLFDQIYLDGGGLRDLLMTPRAFIDGLTASYYGQSAPSSGYAEVDLPGRPGFLTRLGFLASQATPLDSRPVKRGNFILQRLLCTEIGPPGGSPPAALAKEPDETTRDWTARTTEGPSCANCHDQYINPLGFAFEGYDAIGQPRTTESGHFIDSSGSFPFSEGEAAFGNAEELVRLLSDDRLAHQCFTAKMAEYALARDLHEDDKAVVLPTADASLEQGASMQDLLLRLIQSPLFTDARSL